MTRALSGDLKLVRLSSLIQLIEQDELTAVLRTTPQGALGFSQGRLVSASCAGARGVPAVAEAMLLEGGTFTLDQEAVEGQPLGNAFSVILEATQLVDDWRRFAPMVLKSTAALSGTESGRRFEQLFDGELTVAEAFALNGVNRMDEVSEVALAYEAGDLVEAGPPQPGRAESTLVSVTTEEGFYQLLDEARNAMRARDFRAARVALRRALLARPDDRTVQQNLRRLEQIRAAQTSN